MTDRYEEGRAAGGAEPMDIAEMLALITAFREHGIITTVPARVLMLFQTIEGALAHQKRINRDARIAGLREAAEIARAFPSVLYDRDGGRDATCDDIADAIDKAREQATPSPIEEVKP